MWLKNYQLPLTHALHPLQKLREHSSKWKILSNPQERNQNDQHLKIHNKTSHFSYGPCRHQIPNFTAYASSLGIDLSYQNFTTELDSLPGFYSSPSGALFLALTPENEVISCVGLRPLLKTSKSGTLSSGDEVWNSNDDRQEKKFCEMKRLYCNSSSRGLGVGRALIEEVTQEAEKLGYGEMRLDSLPSMEGRGSCIRSMGSWRLRLTMRRLSMERSFKGRSWEKRELVCVEIGVWSVAMQCLCLMFYG
jgi:GNAT superfamily N-acetyltransferase